MLLVVVNERRNLNLSYMSEIFWLKLSVIRRKGIGYCGFVYMMGRNWFLGI